MASWYRARALLAGAAIASTCSIHTPAARSSQQPDDQGPSEEVPEPGAESVAPTTQTRSSPPPPVPPDFAGRSAWLKSRIDEIVALRAPLLPGSRIGIAVYDLATEKMIYEK